MVWVPVPVWKGTTADAMDLNMAITHNCDCQEARRRCSAHKAMLEQRWLDGLLFARYLRERLEIEEGVPDATRDRG